jgi:hypothetical protein
MDLHVVWKVGHDLVHEVQELPPAASLVVAGLDLARGGVQGSEEGGGPVTTVLVGLARQGPSVGEPKPALGSLKGLDVRLLVHAQDYGVLGGVQVEPHDIGRLSGELGIRALAPAPPSLKLDPVPAQDAPDLVAGDPQGLGQTGPVPARASLRGGVVQLGQDRFLRLGAIRRR